MRWPMYLYLYAPFLKQKKYARDLAETEGRVTDFGIGGKIAQLSQFLKLPSAIKEFGVKKFTTVVIAGDDELLEEAIPSLALSQVVVGYIPFSPSRYAAALAIPQGPAEAVGVLAARRIERLDLGRAGERYFLGTLRCQASGLEIHTPTFSLFPKGYATVEVINLREGVDASDGKLEVRLTPWRGTIVKKPESSTVIQAASCRIKSSKPIAVSCDHHTTLKTPLQVDSVPKAIRMIVGRRVKRMKN